MGRMVRPIAWEKEILYDSGDEYFAHLLQAIDQATTSIEFETYIFESGVLAQRMCQALIAAAARGVLVRIIVDGWGSPHFASAIWPQLKAGGVKVRFFRAGLHILARLPGDPRRFWQRLLERWRKINRGNHRKFCLIDGTELWVGSFNVSDVHLREVFGEQAWKDIGVCVRGAEVRHARRAFQRAYRGWTAFNLPARSPRLLLLNDSFIHKRRATLQKTVQLRAANQRIWLATPYFVPIGPIFRRLRKKARQGVDVRLMVPRKNDVWFMKWLSWPMLAALAQSGVKVLVFEPRFSHQKVFIIDDWICIGSTNLNHRSFLHDLEMDVVITHKENQERIVHSYLQDQGQAHTYDAMEIENLPLWKRVVGLTLGSLFSLGRYWS